MRIFVLLAGASMLAACGGDTGPQTIGGTAPPKGPADTPPAGAHSFVNPTEARTYQAIGGVQNYTYSTTDRYLPDPSPQGNQFYAGDASTARNSGITVNYNPRDAIFELTINMPNADVNQTYRFQDPAHRTDFGGAAEPQPGTPQLAAADVRYLQAGTSSGSPNSSPFPTGPAEANVDIGTFFYQKPGTETRYVTFAGFIRNATSVAEMQDNDGSAPYLQQNYTLERAAFVFGERTSNDAVPRTGTGTFAGPMIATMVFNDQFDNDATAPTHFQWIDGRASAKVDFGANKFNVDFTGTTHAPQDDSLSSGAHTIREGAAFAASGSGRIDLVKAGGFLGQVDSASFTQTNGDKIDVNVEGSSVDGAFFGPNADEIGGGFRIVGGTPDERVDIMGAFTGKK